MAETKSFQWVGQPGDVIHSRVNRLEHGVLFEGSNGHIASTGDASKIKFFSEDPAFKEVSKKAAAAAEGEESAEIPSGGGSGTSTGDTVTRSAAGAVAAS